MAEKDERKDAYMANKMRYTVLRAVAIHYYLFCSPTRLMAVSAGNVFNSLRRVSGL